MEKIKISVFSVMQFMLKMGALNAKICSSAGPDGKYCPFKAFRWDEVFERERTCLIARRLCNLRLKNTDSEVRFNNHDAIYNFEPTSLNTLLKLDHTLLADLDQSAPRAIEVDNHSAQDKTSHSVSLSHHAANPCPPCICQKLLPPSGSRA